MSEEPMTYQNLGGDKITTRATVAPAPEGGEGLWEFRYGVLQEKYNTLLAAHGSLDERYVQAADLIDSLTAREAVLREALEKLLNRYVDLVNCGDCGFWDPEKEPEVQAARAALSPRPKE
jgi:hypothetical protein